MGSIQEEKNIKEKVTSMINPTTCLYTYVFKLNFFFTLAYHQTEYAPE